MIRPCIPEDFDQIWAVINDGAEAYRGVIPPDRLRNPYMSHQELRHELDQGVVFWRFELAGLLTAVMGIQNVLDVTLIRHAYVRTGSQKQGIGAQLLAHLRSLTGTPMLLGTWADAVWAIRFYQRHGFELVDPVTRDRLLQKYWVIPERQVATSVVLADGRWRDASISIS